MPTRQRRDDAISNLMKRNIDEIVDRAFAVDTVSGTLLRKRALAKPRPIGGAPNIAAHALRR